MSLICLLDIFPEIFTDDLDMLKFVLLNSTPQTIQIVSIVFNFQIGEGILIGKTALIKKLMLQHTTEALKLPLPA